MKMSPTRFHPKRETLTSTTDHHNYNHNALCPPPLKIHKDSHSIKKSSSPPPPPPPSSSSSSSSVSSSVVNKPIQRHPVIIYTHSPKVIHTHPRDFMALVQKLTGLHRSDNSNDGAADPPPPQQQPAKQEGGNGGGGGGVAENKKACANEENETSSVITEENNCSSSVGETQVNSCFMTNPPINLDAAFNPYMTNLPVFTPNSADLLCSSNQPFLNYDSLFFSHNIRNSMNPSTANLEGMNDFREY